MRATFLLLLFLPFFLLAQSDFTFRIRNEISNSRIDNLVMTNNGNYAITCSADKSIKVWDVKSGDFLWEYTAYYGKGRDGVFTAIDLEPNHNNLIAAGGIFNDGDMNDTISGRVLLFDFKSRQITRELYGHKSVVSMVKFLKDGTHLVSVDKTGNIILWNLVLGTKKVFTTSDREESQIAITSFGFIIASASAKIYMYTPENFPASPNTMLNISMDATAIASVFYVESKKQMLLALFNQKILVYDSLYHLVQTINNGTIASGICSNKTETHIAFGRSFGNSTINFYEWNKDTLIQKQSVDGFYDLVKGLVFTPENDLLLADNATGCISRINFMDGKFRVVRKLQKSSLGVYSVGVPKGTENGKIYFSTGYTIMDRGFSQFNYVFDLVNRKISRLNKTVNYGTKPITELGELSLESGPQEKFSSYSNSLRVIQYGQEDPIMEIKTGNVFRCYTFTLDSQLIIAGGRDGVLEAFNMKSEKICDLQGHDGDIFCINESPDQKFIISSGREGLIHLWDRKEIQNNYRVKPCISMYFINSEDWVIWTAEGYFTSTRSGSKLLGLQQNYGRNKSSQFIPMEVFDFTYNRPDIVFQKLGVSNKDLIQLYQKAALKRLDKAGFKSFPKINPEDLPRIDYLTNNQETKDDTISISFIALSAKGAMKSIKVFNQGVIIKQITLRKSEKSKYEGSAIINLCDGKNTIEIIAFSDSGFRSIGEKLVINKVSKSSKTLYSVFVSVSNYRDTSMQLKYAVKDGRDFRDALLNASTKQFTNFDSDTLFNKTVTKDNIKKINFKLSQLKPNDGVVLYFSGHGFLDKSKIFYYATYNTAKDKPEINGMAFSDIEKLFDDCKALKRLVLIDACHGGEVDKEENEIIEKNQLSSEHDSNVTFKAKGVGYLNTMAKSVSISSFDVLLELFSVSDNENGIEVVAASAGDSYAYESDEWKNGVFTYSLIRALSDTAADRNIDRNLSIYELKRYTSEMVIKLTSGRQKPAMRQEIGLSDWYLR